MILAFNHLSILKHGLVISKIFFWKTFQKFDCFFSFASSVHYKKSRWVFSGVCWLCKLSTWHSFSKKLFAYIAVKLKVLRNRIFIRKNVKVRKCYNTIFTIVLWISQKFIFVKLFDEYISRNNIQQNDNLYEELLLKSHKFLHRSVKNSGRL